MHRLFAVIFVLSCICYAEEKTPNVCVGRPASDSRLMINAKYQQTQLVYQINGRGQNKKAKVRMSAVALEGETVRDAQSMDCDYVVVSEFEAIGGSFQPQVGSIPTLGSREAARRTAQLVYKITEVESGRTISQGVIPVLQMGEDESNALRATRDLGDRICAEVTRARSRLRVE